jgi:hypothetical protein
VKTELTSLIAARALPVGFGANVPIYNVVTPADVNICNADFGAGVCDDTSPGFCAYHSAFVGDGSVVLYAAIPTFFNGASARQNPKSCQADGNVAVQEPNSDLGDVVLKYLSHEDNETITDPLLNAWFNTANGFEDGDNCNGISDNANAFIPTLNGTSSPTLANQLINGNQYYIQSEWSNGDVNCKMRPSGGAITSGLAAPASATRVGSPVSFTPSGSSSNGYSSVTVDFGDGSTNFNNSGSAPSSVSHAFSHAGFYTAKITAVDPMGNIAQGFSSQFTVGSPPNPAFSFSPSNSVTGVPVSFDGTASTDPDAGVTITSSSFSFGDGGSAPGPTAKHTFTHAGTFTVTLVTGNSLGLAANAQHTITVAPAQITSTRVRHRNNKGATIVVIVDAPGTVSGAHRSVPLSGPGSADITIKLTKARRERLARKGKLTIKVPITFTPSAGAPVRKTVTIKFKTKVKKTLFEFTFFELTF